MASFVVALFPLVIVVATFIFPFIQTMYAAVWPDAIRAVAPQMPAGTNGTYTREQLAPLFRLYAEFFLMSMGIAILALVAITDSVISKYATSLILRLSGARPVEPGEEENFAGIVENLCLGAGLPVPRLYVIESATPNAFATGLTPRDASLVVTRGLLELLDRRELEGVIAHEISHIGNQDIRLGTTLAGLMGTVSLPLRVITAPIRIAFRLPSNIGAIIMVAIIAVVVGHGSILPGWSIVSLFILVLGIQFSVPGPPNHWWFLLAQWVPVYIVFGPPVIGLLIRQSVSRQREFLADADAALLTRDPEGLALALVKIGAVRGQPLQVEEGIVHLYFVDPLPAGSWLHTLFPSHPPLEKRVALLSRMGNGIARSTIEEARNEGARFARESVPPEPISAPDAGLSSDETLAPPKIDHPATADGRTNWLYGCKSEEGFVPLYERPEAGSRVVALLPQEATVTMGGRQGDFMRITAEGGIAGYAMSSS